MRRGSRRLIVATTAVASIVVGVRPPAAPASALLVELGACSADERASGTPVRPVREVLDEVEQPFVGPVEVLEDEHERACSASASKKRRQAANTCSRRSSAGVSCTPRPTSGRSMALDPRRLCRVGHEVADRRGASFSAATPASSPRADPCLRLDHFAERPERDAIAVGQTAATAAT